MDTDKKTKLGLFFTWDISLKDWQVAGFLEREIDYYSRLCANDIEVTFFTWGNEEDAKIAKTLNLPVHVMPAFGFLPNPKSKILRFFISLLHPLIFIRQIKEQDILKTNQMWGSWVAVFGSLLLRKPLIIRCGYELFRFAKESKLSSKKTFFIYWASRFAYRNATKIYVTTVSDKEFVASTFSVARNKISVRPNWINTSLFCSSDVHCEQNRVLFVGRLSEEKNIPLLLQALKHTKWGLDIIGDGLLKSKIVQLAKKLGVELRLLGLVTNTHLPNYYCKYPVVVLTSKFEGNPKTLLEAMSCGRAVLGTNVSGINEVVSHGKTGLLCMEDPQEIALKLNDLMTNSKLRSKLGKAARAQIVENQSIDALIQKEMIDLEELQKK